MPTEIDVPKNSADRVRKWRGAYRLTLLDLGARTKLGYERTLEIERGKKPPTAREWARIVKVMPEVANGPT